MKKMVYKEAPKDVELAIRSSRKIKDFLPPPNLLVQKEELARITINLNRKSLQFFKSFAKKSGVPYQRMINSVLDRYVSEYSSVK